MWHACQHPTAAEYLSTQPEWKREGDASISNRTLRYDLVLKNWPANADMGHADVVKYVDRLIPWLTPRLFFCAAFATDSQSESVDNTPGPVLTADARTLAVAA